MYNALLFIALIATWLNVYASQSHTNDGPPAYSHTELPPSYEAEGSARLTADEIYAFITGHVISSLIPSIAENADSIYKVSPSCLSRLIRTNEYFTDRGAALLFEKHKKYPRLIGVVTPLGMFPCFKMNEEQERKGLGNIFSEKNMYIFEQINHLVKTSGTPIEIRDNKQLFGLAIESLPGVYRLIHRPINIGPGYTMHNFFTFNEGQRTTRIEPKRARDNTLIQNIELCSTIIKDHSEIDQLIHAATLQIKSRRFDTHNGTKMIEFSFK